MKRAMKLLLLFTAIIAAVGVSAVEETGISLDDYDEGGISLHVPANFLIQESEIVTDVSSERVRRGMALTYLRETVMQRPPLGSMLLHIVRLR